MAIMQKALVAMAVTACVTTGCSLQPDYVRPALPVAASYPSGAAYGAANNDASTGAAPLPEADRLAASDLGWSEFFADPRLQRVIELGLRHNRDLRIAILNMQEARAQYQVERASLLPSISAGASSTREREPAGLYGAGVPAFTLQDDQVAASAAWEIDLFGKQQSLSAEAYDTYLASAQARKAAELTLVSEIADQYLTMEAYDEMLQLTRSTLSTEEASYRLTKLELDTGTGSELDVREAESALRQAQANQASEMRLRAQAENALVLLTGAPLPQDLPPAISLDHQQLLRDIPAGLPSDLLDRRPDIVQAEDALKAANANIGAARAAFFPSISLTGEYGSASTSLGGLFKPGSTIWSFGPSITVPIFQGGQNRANLDLAKLEKNAAIAQYEKTIQTAFREVADGLAARGTYDRQVAALREEVATQQRRYQLSDLRFRTGVDGYLTVLTAQQSLYSAQEALVDASLSRLTNLVDLYQYLGGGWIEHTGDTPRSAQATGEGT